MARILLIEDDEIFVELVTDYLEAAGHMVSAIHHGDEALRAVDESAPELLILDYNLPGMTGLEILREVRRRSYGEHLPVLMLTAKPGRLLPVRAHHDGVDDYLTKPVAPEPLLQRVEALLISAALARRLTRAVPGSC